MFEEGRRVWEGRWRWFGLGMVVVVVCWWFCVAAGWHGLDLVGCWSRLCYDFAEKVLCVSLEGWLGFGVGSC